ncbi:MAG TPA: hypothetical protein VIC87_01390, partial [Vicinamibacteria bacterium]
MSARSLDHVPARRREHEAPPWRERFGHACGERSPGRRRRRTVPDAVLEEREGKLQKTVVREYLGDES